MFKFIGWYQDTNLFNFSTILDEDITLNAKWKEVYHSVVMKTNTSSQYIYNEVKHGELVKEPTNLSKPGYTFLGYTKDGKEYDFKTPITTDGIIIVANWEMNKDTLEAYLSSIIPSQTSSDLSFVEHIEFCSATFTWETSNHDVITNYGKYKNPINDEVITVSVTVQYSNEEYTLDFKTSVKAIKLKEIKYGSIVSGYLYDSGSTNLSEDALSKLDYINYSFAKIVNGELYINNPTNLKKICEYRKSGVRIILAVGGWGSGGFSNAMKTEQGRTRLANSVIKTIKEYSLDGLDIDWEYPTSGVAGIDYDANDRTNLNLFCKQLKELMLSYRSDLLLTMAVTPSVAYFDFVTLNKYVDIYNLMTYDYNIGHTNAHHDSALYTVANASTTSLDANVKTLCKYVDAKKIIPGAAFYGRYGTFASSQSKTLGALLTKPISSSISYAKIKNMLLKNPSYVEQYDEKACAAYMIVGNTFYSYDNSRSILDKCTYIKNNNLAGIMCWELSQDYINENDEYELLNAMHSGLKS